jgi:hypothetical protein
MEKAGFPHRSLEGFAARVVHVFVEEHRLCFGGEDDRHKVIRDGADLDLVGEVPGEDEHG